MGRHVAKKKFKAHAVKKRIQISKTQKLEFKKNEELKTANKTLHGVRSFIHDTPCDFHDTPCDFKNAFF